MRPDMGLDLSNVRETEAPLSPGALPATPRTPRKSTWSARGRRPEPHPLIRENSTTNLDEKYQHPLNAHIDLDGGHGLQLADLEPHHHWLLDHYLFMTVINLSILASGLQMGLSANEQTDSDVPEHAFTFIFMVEMVLKISVRRLSYFSNPDSRWWNILDFCIAWTSIIDSWMLPMAPDSASLSNWMNSLRVFRLLRLLRIMKLLHSVPELVLVLEGFLASVKSMVWIMVLLIAIIYTWSIVFVEIVGKNSSYYASFNMMDTSFKEEMVDSFNNYLFFGTVERAMMSLFNVILLAEWGTVARPLWEAQPAMIMPLIILVFITTFGIFNVIVGVIVDRMDQAMKRSTVAKEENERKKRVRNLEDMAVMVFASDRDDDSKLSQKEWQEATAHLNLSSVMQEITLPHGFSLKEFHEMLDSDGSGALSRREFVLGMLRLIEGDTFQQNCLNMMMIGQVKSQIYKMQVELRSEILQEIAASRRVIESLLSSGFEGGGNGGGHAEMRGGRYSDPRQPAGDPRLDRTGNQASAEHGAEPCRPQRAPNPGGPRASGHHMNDWGPTGDRGRQPRPNRTGENSNKNYRHDPYTDQLYGGDAVDHPEFNGYEGSMVEPNRLDRRGMIGVSASEPQLMPAGMNGHAGARRGYDSKSPNTRSGHNDSRQRLEAEEEAARALDQQSRCRDEDTAAAMRSAAAPVRGAVPYAGGPSFRQHRPAVPEQPLARR